MSSAPHTQWLSLVMNMAPSCWRHEGVRVVVCQEDQAEPACPGGQPAAAARVAEEEDVASGLTPDDK